MGRTPTDRRLDLLLADLTEPQAEAVRHRDGPLLVLAGAGCGKTRVITRRAAYLACTATNARNVLAITFTNKAANEMRERMIALGVGGEMTVCTFHSLAARLLRTYHQQAHLPGDFTIFDSADQRKVLKEAIERAELSTENWTPARAQAVISRAKNAMVTAKAFAAEAGDWGQRTLSRIYDTYEQILTEQHGLDFDDLLLKLALLLAEDEGLRRRLERRYTHVLIDEYQDTNSAQYEIAHLITEQHHNICATGDPDQSIYGWRGADIGNILSFEKDFPEAKVVRLERNYRSTKRILSAASAVIEHNVARKEKTLWTKKPEGRRVRVISVEDADDEAQYIAEQIAARQSQGKDYADVAVFYRINALSRAIEEALIRAGIPYQVARGTEFYNRKEIKDVLAYARVLINPRDEVSLTRIINTPTRGLGKTTVERLLARARATNQELFKVLEEPQQIAAMNKGALVKVTGFATLLKSMEPLIDAAPRAALEQVLSLSGLQASLARTAEHDIEPLENVGELINAAAAFEEIHPEATLREWLEYTSLLSDVDSIEEGGGRVTLMTLHAAKGLEFPTVYIIALEDGMLPFRRQPADAEYDEEEERRLCFVGMTRAQEELNLSHADYRMVRGASERKVRSGFLHELPAEEIEWVDWREDSDDSGPRRSPAGELPPDLELWGVGTLVRHPRYDLGQIMAMQPNGAQTRLRVQFQDGTEKTFILRFSKLERVDFDEVG